MDFERLDEIARSLMLGRRSHVEREVGHVYYHGVRTMRGVAELRRRVTADGSHDELLRAAALLPGIAQAAAQLAIAVALNAPLQLYILTSFAALYRWVEADGGDD